MKKILMGILAMGMLGGSALSASAQEWRHDRDRDCGVMTTATGAKTAVIFAGTRTRSTMIAGSCAAICAKGTIAERKRSAASCGTNIVT